LDASTSEWRCTTTSLTKRAVPETSNGKTEDATSPDARLSALLEQYGALLHRTIVRVCPRELGLLCDDIEQEARLSLWKALQSGREISFPISYIYKVAVSATLRAVRRAKARREDPVNEESEAGPLLTLRAPNGASPHAEVERREIAQKVEAALLQLAENRRLAVKNHLQGLTTPEIGALLGWSEPKARNLVHRGLRDLRVALRMLGIECKS
jgi:RNA polymerase sigma factor (sigma-70 family)